MMMRYITTLIFVAVAGFVGYTLYSTYDSNPWTRDGQVRAYIVEITPRVTGQVTHVHVNDNVQVKKGDLLFEIDQSVYQASLNKTLASKKQASALLKKARDEQRRAVSLEKRAPGAVPVLTLNNLGNAVETAKANLEVMQAAVEEAKLNLEFTKVYAPTDGYITNLQLREGSQVTANTPVVALIDEDSFWIEGFFKETDLQGVDEGDLSFVTLLTQSDRVLEAEIKSVGYGISMQDGSTGNSLLPVVNPNFEWIRLAQRIPVKVKLTHVPEDIQLRIGMTASVKIIKGENPQ
ncbi:HlyD family secretion protein [Vibrio breoganii]|uniref:Efflux transporter periplasmic adaptor subunit n=2 Tax=Vibrio TaxID=662 RepID=A0AAN1CU27_9VIBR|nr:HlyD family secretion protein [Vibrio breoganii]ANO35180.1 efflux transporter periplasmic adaptor subunit [Vibrio breoganii]NMO74483.1 HlyD family secretion protein [Vibrio breoganii]NMR69875.1 HlyD family secretion protein [Vibrio breoganii]OED92501.1 efflux transporter periplasmic adaptor subunit [Vibrio breoganii ZF-55]OED96511.1 efflux transporter periplasmic adaptor subunit [Vibrio breoganii ZF-29]